MAKGPGPLTAFLYKRSAGWEVRVKSGHHRLMLPIQLYKRRDYAIMGVRRRFPTAIIRDTTKARFAIVDAYEPR